MGWVRAEAPWGLRCCILGVVVAAAGLSFTSDVADARYHARWHGHSAHHGVRGHRLAGGLGYSPPTAAIVVDGNNGEVLHESNPDALRHPASLTKIMTLYLLFERLDAGKIALDTPLKITEHASEQAPSKLGLRPGQTIEVEDAIKAVVTRSANDVAVAIAENLGGDEDTFAKLMTQKARALGMSRTTYVNASGLPDDDQITTARDQALLGRAIEDRFPRYYRYFSTRTFVYRGEAIRNHNHLLGAVGGVDGIKTGYTRASGFNLVTSVHRDGRYLIAVVLGGRSALQRDAHMRDLIDTHIREAGARRTAPVVAERDDPRAEAQPVTLVKTAPPASRSDPAPTTAAGKRAAARGGASGSSDPIHPVLVRTITYRTTPLQTASLAPLPSLTPAGTQPQAVAAPAPARPQAVPVEPGPVASIARADEEPAEATRSAAFKSERASSESGAIPRIETAKVEPVRPEPAPARSHVRGGWLIQIGAFDGEDEAREHLSAAVKAYAALTSADPFTERVQKGDRALYRARFAGFDKAGAEATCRELRRNDIECMALRN